MLQTSPLAFQASQHCLCYEWLVQPLSKTSSMSISHPCTDNILCINLIIQDHTDHHTDHSSKSRVLGLFGADVRGLNGSNLLALACKPSGTACGVQELVFRAACYIECFLEGLKVSSCSIPVHECSDQLFAWQY